MPKRRFHRTRNTAVVSLLLLTALSGCRRGAGQSPPTGSTPALLRLRTSLALVPAEARIVFALDLERLRATPLGQRLLAGPAKQAALFFDGFAKGTGIDVLSQARQVVAAVPGERHEDDRFVLIVDVDHIDEARVAAWLGQRAQDTPRVFIHGANRIAVAQGAWAAEAARLAAAASSTPSAASNPELRRLCERAVGNHAFGFAAIVPAELRRNLATDLRFPDIASLARLSAFIDAESSLRGEAVAELSNAADATSLAHRLGAYVNAAKHHPDMLARGLAPYLEALRLAPRGPHLRATFELGAAQADDLVFHIEEFVRAGRSQVASSQRPTTP